MGNLLDKYYIISNEIINNYDTNRINYHNLKNLCTLKKNDEDLIKELNNLINCEKLDNIYDFSFQNFYLNDGEKYIGGMNDGLKNGKGILFSNQDCEKNRKNYEGEFQNNKREGKGIMYYNNGDKYEGDFINDKREGKEYYIITLD